MKLENFEKSIEKYANYVIQQARTNLTKNDNKDGKLYNSLSYKISSTAYSFVVRFFMENYGIFQDKGVKGTESNYIENSKSPFSYKSKGGKFGLKGMPPPKAFDKWTVRKGLAPRDSKGRFLERKTLNFLIARSIFKKGIKSTNFFSKPFEKGQIKYGDDFLQGIAKDIENQKK
tara:strand:+ start:257 stop:778 length:522 start_codon:yes stop_codon:yes gene_type:complete